MHHPMGGVVTNDREPPTRHQSFVLNCEGQDSLPLFDMSVAFPILRGKQRDIELFLSFYQELLYLYYLTCPTNFLRARTAAAGWSSTTNQSTASRLLPSQSLARFLQTLVAQADSCQNRD